MIYNFYIFDRKVGERDVAQALASEAQRTTHTRLASSQGTCLYYREWNREFNSFSEAEQDEVRLNVRNRLLVG
jgi:hypothetical protein